MNTQRLIAAAEFKQKCLALMDEVAAMGKEIVVTKHGTPICKLIPFPTGAGELRFGRLKGSVKIQGDLTQPQEDIWEAGQ